MNLPGADGSGVSVVDIEFDWLFDHEDLELPSSANIDAGNRIVNRFGMRGTNHGTAVLGELGAKNNGYGVTGIVPGAVLRVAPATTERYGFNPARAISLATRVSSPGDVILLELQICVCNQSCPGDDSQRGFGPLEWFQPAYDAIAAATAKGITVVEAAGNGQVNLDSSGCQRRFDRNSRDSGAIIVGAGSSRDRSRLQFSNYGSRVDLQGWGHLVTTTGYGHLFNPGDIRQHYTSTFGGTSSASPIVAGAVAIVQGIVKAAGRRPLNPAQVRNLLATTGKPQGSPRGENIGPLPNLPAAVRMLRLDESEDDHGNNCSGATQVSLPSTTRGILERSGDLDYFRFSVSRAGRLRAETRVAPIPTGRCSRREGDGSPRTTTSDRTTSTSGSPQTCSRGSIASRCGALTALRREATR